MKALLKIEWIKTWRSWPIFILGIGMPVAFYLLYSSIVTSPTPKLQKEFLKTYMLTMTGFSMSSFGLFTFPYMLQEDQTEHWLTYIEHSKISIWAYYLSKIFRVLCRSSARRTEARCSSVTESMTHRCLQALMWARLWEAALTRPSRPPMSSS